MIQKLIDKYTQLERNVISKDDLNVYELNSSTANKSIPHTGDYLPTAWYLGLVSITYLMILKLRKTGK